MDTKELKKFLNTAVLEYVDKFGHLPLYLHAPHRFVGALAEMGELKFPTSDTAVALSAALQNLLLDTKSIYRGHYKSMLVVAHNSSEIKLSNFILMNPKEAAHELECRFDFAS